MKKLLAIAAALVVWGNAHASTISVTSVQAIGDVEQSVTGMSAVTTYMSGSTLESWVTPAASHLPMNSIALGREVRAAPASLHEPLHSIYVLGNKVNAATTTGVVAKVPLPAAAWLFGSALVGFVMLANRRKV